MSSRFLFETFVPPINIRRPATNPVIPMKVKPNAQEYVATSIGNYAFLGDAASLLESIGFSEAAAILYIAIGAIIKRKPVESN